METAARIVTSLPLAQLWDEKGMVLAAQRTRTLGREDVRQVLCSHADLKLVVADVGSPLCWIEPSARFSFWEVELAPHLGELSADPLYLEDFPGSYFYVASEWRLDTGEAIVLVEKQH